MSDVQNFSYSGYVSELHKKIHDNPDGFDVLNLNYAKDEDIYHFHYYALGFDDRLSFLAELARINSLPLHLVLHLGLFYGKKQDFYRLTDFCIRYNQALKNDLLDIKLIDDYINSMPYSLEELQEIYNAEFDVMMAYYYVVDYKRVPDEITDVLLFSELHNE